MYAPSHSFHRSRRSGLLAVLLLALMAIAAALLMFWGAANRLPVLIPGGPPGKVRELPWNLTLVNWENPLPEDFAAPELIQLRNGHAIDVRAYDNSKEEKVDAN